MDINEDKIFGPFTFKQMVICFVGVGAIYLAHDFFSDLRVTGLISIIIIFITVTLVKKNAPPIIDEDYIRRKRYEFTTKEEFDIWLKNKIRNTVAYMDLRKSKGMTEDPSLARNLKMFETALADSK
jgi:hypothetical protein